MSMIKTIALAASLFAIPAVAFAGSNSSAIIQGGENSQNVGVTSQMGENNAAATVQGGQNSTNVGVTQQQGCNNAAGIAQLGANSVNVAGVGQTQLPGC